MASAGLMAGGAFAWVRPQEMSGAMPSYFAKLSEALKISNHFEPTILLDLDRLDHNIGTCRQVFGNDLSYRLSAKSLPSASLQRYVMKEMGSKKIMAFHVPYLEDYLAYDPDVDILLGKVVLTESVAKFFSILQSVPGKDAADRIQWLADDAVRVRELLELARGLNMGLRVNLEIDIGLRRGGASNNQDLAAMLQIIQDNPDHLTFSGFMGYDGHVPAAPPPFFTVDRSFASAMQAYEAFHDFAKKNFGDMFQANLTLNSGGSKTYQRFGTQHFVNEVAAGSCMVKPSTFSELKDHQPALFIAAPVVKENDGLTVPFLDDYSNALSVLDPNAVRSWYVYGGGWAADTVAPEGVSPTGIVSDPPNQNLMPNQSLYNGPRKAQLNKGDFVFLQPQQGDAMFQFEKIALIRNGQVTGYWDTFNRKF